MKRLVFSLLMVVFVLQGFSKGIDTKQAKVVAEDFLSTRSKTALTADEAVVFQSKEVALTYVINFQPEGWAIVSADDRAPAILGYSNKGHFDTEEVKNLPFYFWFQIYADQITALISSKAPENVHPSWSNIKNSTYSKAIPDIEPIIEVNWNQSAGWNEYCPVDKDGPGGHAYAGCVAVAMAQCMSVYQHPTQGYGSSSYSDETYGYQSVNYGEATYEWSKMNNNSATDATALLLYHLGVSVKMGYGADGSGAFSRNVPSAIKNYFDYSNSAVMISRSDYTDEEWENILIEQLSSGQPIYYAGDAGDNEAGHAFNIDGVNPSGQFHFNFGWSGSYNGYYYVTGITPGSNDFTSNQEAIINFIPRNHAPQDISVLNKTVEEGMPIGTIVGRIVVSDETPEDTFIYEVSTPIGVSGLVPFTEQDGNLVTTEVLDYSENNRYEIKIKATDKTNLSIEKNFFIKVDSNAAPTNITITQNAFNDTISKGSFVGVLKTADQDEDETFTYVFKQHDENSEIGKDNNKFVLLNDTICTNYDFSGADEGECSLYIQSSDKLGETVSKEIVLTIAHISMSTSDNVTTLDDKLKVFPNPVTDYLYVVSSTSAYITSVHIYDITGMLKDNYQLNEKNTSIDFMGYATGIYLVNISLDNGTQQTVKILKK